MGAIGGLGFPFAGNFGRDIALIVIVFVLFLLFVVFGSIGFL